MKEMIGIGCPTCGSVNTEVADTRAKQHYIRRRRYCPECKNRFSTWELTAESAAVAEGLVRELSGLPSTGEMTQHILKTYNSLAELMFMLKPFAPSKKKGKKNVQPTV